MGAYLRLLGSLVQNLARRLGEDLADCAVVCRRGVVYKLRSIRLRYDDVGPSSEPGPDWQAPPQQLAALVESVRNKPWFCELDRKTAQDLVHDGGAGCFLVRPSASTKSLTLTLWHRHRAYNILVRQREDGLLALGSWKSQEMTFLTVEQMVRYYEREPLILYSGGELAGTTRLKAPPPGLVRCPTTKRNSSMIIGRRPSEGLHRSSNVNGLRTLSFGSAEVPFNASRPLEDHLHRSAPVNSLRTFSSENFDGLFSAPRYLPAERVPNLSAPADSRMHSSETFKGPLRGNPYTEEILNVAALRGVKTFSPEITKNPYTEPRSPTEVARHAVVSDNGMIKTLSSGNFAAAPAARSSMNKRRAVSTPNIDIPGISSDTCHRRNSCDNLTAISPPPTVSPRTPSSFVATQRNEVQSYPSFNSELSSSLYHQQLPNRTFTSAPTAVHSKTPALSVSNASSNSQNCSC